MAQTENFNIPGTTTWTVPAIGTITGGQGTNHITFTALTKGTGQVCVQVTNLTCTGVPSCITIDIKEVPAIPVFKQN
jgi:hypothetical protein